LEPETKKTTRNGGTERKTRSTPQNEKVGEYRVGKGRVKLSTVWDVPKYIALEKKKDSVEVERKARAVPAGDWIEEEAKAQRKTDKTQKKNVLRKKRGAGKIWGDGDGGGGML